ncbi:MAG: iron-containing alcohol dehydrogenase family protein [Candidatus Dormibacteraceae bacterium]
MSSLTFPGRLELHPGALAELALIRRSGRRRVLLVSDRGVAAAGPLDRALAVLRAAGLEVRCHVQMPGEPTLESVAAAEQAREAVEPHAVIGVGGGAVMDVAKAVAALATNGGGLAERWGEDRFPRPALPLALVPTTAGTGSEVSRFIVLVDGAALVKRVAGSPVLLPELAIVDADLTLGLPPRVTADAGMDALTHAVEAYLGRGASAFSDALALQATALVAAHLERAFADPQDRPAREAMATAGTLAGLAFNAAGLGAVHALGYPLDIHHQVPHGRANAILLAPVLERFEGAATARLRTLAATVCAPRFTDWVEGLLPALGIAPRLREHGVADVAAARALGAEGWETGSRLLGNSPRTLSREEAEAIYGGRW